MASSLESDSACVVWNINSGLNKLPPVLKSKPFLLFGSERILELHFNYNTFSYKLHLKPPLISSRIQFSYFEVDSSSNSVLFYHTAVMPNLYSEMFDSTRIKNSSKSTSSLPKLAFGCSPSVSSFSSPSGGLFSSSPSMPSLYSESFGSTRIKNYAWNFSLRTKIICLFEPILPPSKTSPEDATICIGCKHRSLEDLSSDFGRFLEDKSFPDVILKCGDRTMSAHRAVLAARSSVFAAMFRNKMAESETGVVEIGDMNPDMLEDFLTYLYTGNIKNMSENNVHFLFAIGDRYDVRPLLKECSQWIRNNLTRQNCIGYLYMAGTYNYEYLINIVAEFIVRDSSIFKSEDWSQFKKLNSVVAVSVYDKYINTLPK